MFQGMKKRFYVLVAFFIPCVAKLKEKKRSSKRTKIET